MVGYRENDLYASALAHPFIADTGDCMWFVRGPHDVPRCSAEDQSDGRSVAGVSMK